MEHSVSFWRIQVAFDTHKRLKNQSRQTYAELDSRYLLRQQGSIICDLINVDRFACYALGIVTQRIL